MPSVHPAIVSDPSSVERGSSDNFTFNQETELLPILGMAEEQFNAATEKAEKKSTVEIKATDVREHHHTALLEVLSQELSVVPEDIHDFELYAFEFTSHVLELTSCSVTCMIPSPPSSAASRMSSSSHPAWTTSSHRTLLALHLLSSFDFSPGSAHWMPWPLSPPHRPTHPTPAPPRRT